MCFNTYYDIFLTLSSSFLCSFSPSLLASCFSHTELLFISSKPPSLIPLTLCICSSLHLKCSFSTYLCLATFYSYTDPARANTFSKAVSFYSILHVPPNKAHISHNSTNSLTLLNSAGGYKTAHAT